MQISYLTCSLPGQISRISDATRVWSPGHLFAHMSQATLSHNSRPDIQFQCGCLVDSSSPVKYSSPQQYLAIKPQTELSIIHIWKILIIILLFYIKQELIGRVRIEL